MDFPPYILDTKEPIHYENTDKSRDDFFVKNGFIVIRFTEEQILLYPEKCLHLIDEVVASCVNLEGFTKSKNYIQIESNILSQEESFNLAYNNSRQNLKFKIQQLERNYTL